MGREHQVANERFFDHNAPQAWKDSRLNRVAAARILPDGDPGGPYLVGDGHFDPSAKSAAEVAANVPPIFLRQGR